MKTRLLHSYGKRDIAEYEWTMPPLSEDSIRVKTIMTGVCRSDIGVYGGMEEPMPFGKFGHEGLGEVVEVGKQARGARVGDIVATFSDPAYSDYYFAKEQEFVVVPEADPKYILQPVACAINIMDSVMKVRPAIRSGHTPFLVLGTGFLSLVIGHMPRTYDNMTVVGRSNAKMWKDMGIRRYDSIEEVTGEFPIIIDLSSKAENFDKAVDKLQDNGLLVYAATPTAPVTTNFFKACWKAATISLPSPRSKGFYNAMCAAGEYIEYGDIDVSWLWTRGYDRQTDFKKAFEDGLNRPAGYIRGYIKW